MLTRDAHYFGRIDNGGSCDIDELDGSDDGTNRIGHKPTVVRLSQG